MRSVVAGKIADLIGASVSDSLLTRVISHNRVFAIVDGLSEKSADTQSKLALLEPEMRFRRVLITSRVRETTMGLPVAFIEPRRLTGPTLANFLSAYVDKSKVSDEEFYEACKRLSILIRTSNVTPLFVALYGKMLAPGGDSGRNMPKDIPGLVQDYIANNNNRVVEPRKPLPTVLAWTKSAAWACLQPNLLPSEISREKLLSAGEAAGRPLTDEAIEYMSSDWVSC